jgi:hypothetical protein
LVRAVCFLVASIGFKLGTAYGASSCNSIAVCYQIA